MANLRKVQPEEIELNKCYSAPVFFDDGKNMFLAPYKLVKKYHIDCLKRWDVPFLWTSGQEVDAEKALKMEQDKAAGNNAALDAEDVEELVDLDEFQ